MDAKCSEAAQKRENVTLVGLLSRDEVRNELREADVFAFLSYFSGEGFSNALVEGMASGLPCLVSDWAANKDMIGDDGGFVVSIKRPDEAAAALKKMFSQEMRQHQSQRNIEKVRTEYSASVVLDQYVDCYESCLNQ